MSKPDAKQIEAFLRLQMDLFNKGDRDGFIAAHRSIAPNGFQVEDPVGSPVRDGPQVIEALFDRYVGWQLEFVDLIINGSEAAAYVRNVGIYEGVPVTAYSLETYHFGEGTFLARYFHPAMSA